MDICTCFHSYSLFRAFSNPCVSVNTLSLSRVDIVISRSGSPHDASHLPSIFVTYELWVFVWYVIRLNSSRCSCKNDKFRVCVNYKDSVGIQILYFANYVICLFMSKRLISMQLECCGSFTNPRFAVHRMERRICANLNLTYL